MSDIKERTVTDFFIKDKPAWAVYDATRKLPSFVDGLKNSQRKLLWTGFDKLQKDYCKTETFSNITALQTAYIHGAQNLCGVCDSMVQNFIGACNYPYFLGNDGGWGSRLITRSSAPRYTKLKLDEISKILFSKIDNDILDKQWFEGQWIEPKYLVPIFPTLFLNSSNGLTAGFSENIYSRNPKQIIKYLKKRLNNEDVSKVDLAPWFRNYRGTIRFNKIQGVYESVGQIRQNNMTSYTITEIPVEMTYQKFIEHLDKLEEDHVIQGYEDKCNPRTNEILFEIKTTRDFTRKHDPEDLLKVFKLVRSLPEQYNCIDESGRVVEFSSVQEILEKYIKIRYDLYVRRKQVILQQTKDELERLVSKYLFCKAIIDKTLIVSNRKKDEIVSDLEKMEKIKKIEDSYDYLLRIPISQITNEEMVDLGSRIKSLKDEFMRIRATSEKDMWISDLEKLEKIL